MMFGANGTLIADVKTTFSAACTDVGASAAIVAKTTATTVIVTAEERCMECPPIGVRLTTRPGGRENDPNPARR